MIVALMLMGAPTRGQKLSISLAFAAYSLRCLESQFLTIPAKNGEKPKQYQGSAAELSFKCSSSAALLPATAPSTTALNSPLPDR
ncbi:hypothetical protein HaloA020_16970 [Halomonas sp. A020]|nr:hypothetical protein HaloA020_16970 [Halomonas sp. A020]